MFTLICGPMFSGKTAELIRLARRDQIGGRNVQLFKYAGDARYADENHMASYDGTSLQAIRAQSAQDVVRLRDAQADVVVIDEVQFFDCEIIALIRGLSHQGFDVRAAGLSLNFRGEPFPFADAEATMADLMIYADRVVTLSAVCTYAHGNKVCGAEATRTQRLIDGRPAPYDAPVFAIGAQEMYEARCIEHHEVLGRPAMMRCVKQKELELA